MKLYTLSSYVMTGLCLLGSAAFANAAPLAGEEPETQLFNVEFVLLQNNTKSALKSESWYSSEDDLERMRANLIKLQDADSATYNMTGSEASQAGELMTNLQPLLRRGQFSVLYSNSWKQPQSQKRNTHQIETSIDNLGTYDLGFGKLRLEERSALVAKLTVDIIDTVSLQQTPDALSAYMPSNFNNSLVQPLSAIHFNQPSEASQPINVPFAISEPEPTPILFLNQQRQIKINRIHYFDHPIIPGFLLVSDTPATI